MNFSKYSLDKNIKITAIELFATELETELKRVSECSIKDRGVFRIGLAGGSLIEIMAKINWDDWNDLDKWDLILVDERCVPLNDVDSNYGEYQRRCPKLMKRVRFVTRSAYLPEGTIPRLQTFKELLTTVIQEPLDLAIMGIGPDGHVASIFPPINQEPLPTSQLMEIYNAPKPPPHRLTLSLSYLAHSQRILLVVSGLAKAEIIKRILLEGEFQLPATALIRESTRAVSWLIDEEAATILTGSTNKIS